MDCAVYRLYHPPAARIIAFHPIFTVFYSPIAADIP